MKGAKVGRRNETIKGGWEEKCDDKGGGVGISYSQLQVWMI